MSIQRTASQITPKSLRFDAQRTGESVESTAKNVAMLEKNYGLLLVGLGATEKGDRIVTIVDRKQGVKGAEKGDIISKDYTALGPTVTAATKSLLSKISGKIIKKTDKDGKPDRAYDFVHGHVREYKKDGKVVITCNLPKLNILA